MVTRTSSRTLPGTYVERVKRFPLTHIRDDEHLQEAQGVIDGLLREDRDEGAQEYLDALSDLVEVYEDEHHPIPVATGVDVLRELMGTNKLSQQKLAKSVGITQSTISAILNGARPLTMRHIEVLARFFHVSPAVFLPV